MSGVFGRQTQPQGTADAIVGLTPQTLNQNPNGDPDANGDPNGNNGVPPFEGAESGNVTESTPVNSDTSDETTTTEGDETTQPQVDVNQLAWQVAQNNLEAREAKVAADEARLAQQRFEIQNGGGQQQDTFEEVKFTDEIDIDELSSEGEKVLYNTLKKAETVVNEVRKENLETKQELATAQQTIRNVDNEANIQRVIAEYGVSRAELDVELQNTGVLNLDSLAKGVLYNRAVLQQNQEKQQTTKNLVKQATDQRTKEASKVTGNPAAPSGPPTGDGPRGGGNLNPFDGAEIAKHYTGLQAN